ncbi:MAG: hypothetical protein PHF70_09805 [Opitutales bacterium]|nr:hypothetical protein [Opitutales bacterium]
MKTTQETKYEPLTDFCIRHRISRFLAQRWMDQGFIPFVRFGRHIRIPYPLADEAIASRIQNTNQR